MWLAARVRSLAAGRPLITQASLTSITYTVTDLATGLVLGSGTITIASSVYDALQQTDPGWTRDSAAQPGNDGAFGYNFAFVLPASLNPYTVSTDGTVHRLHVDVIYTPVSGDAYRQNWEWTPTAVFA